ncbi:hypothetical protein WH52_04540 [Tenacibaculum holothuriorum]|uniref:Uncharacterized protein n=1 Tax=Tenacibaculum holothuriorum TaxID=1635173 RepID=A0A1Y2PGL4_9FLAO|nr:tetratricopeptide repeat protein [Tenacibaculum holothuriorum]OSY88937.1 hypothetical protein WH52_04540 [Tenacibaculum holothuriorum]
MISKFPLIDKYFEDSLSAEEKKEFDSLLSNDSEFQKEFQYQKDVQFAIKSNERERLKKELQNLENTTITTKRKGFSRKWLAAASVIILLASFSYLLLVKESMMSNQELYNTYYTPYENVIHPLVRDDNSSLTNDAFLAYETNNYTRAVSLFTEAYKETKTNDLLLYKGISLLETKNTEEAIHTFNNYLETNPKYKTQTFWYLALANLNSDNKPEAKKWLEKVVLSNQEFKKEEAKELLKKLN